MANPIKIINGIIEVEEQVADFIANGPEDGIEGWVRDAYRTRCDQFANLPGWARALSGPARGSFGRICKPFFDDRGFDGPQLAPPFQGGQCPGTVYQYSVTAQSQNSANVINATGKTIGPITSFRFTKEGGNIAGFLTSSGPITASSCGVSAGGATSPSEKQLFNTVDRQYTDPVFVITGTCSGSDDCGDPPSEPQPGPNPPPDPGPLPGPEPTDDPDGGPIPFIPVPPFDDPLGGPTPIEPLPPDDGGGGDGGNPPNASGGDGLPGDPDAVSDSAGGTTGGDDGADIDFGPPPEGRAWVGCLVESTVDPRLGNIPGTGPANTVYPTAIANCSLRFASGRSSSFMIKSKWFSLFRPSTALVLEGAFIQAQPGVSCSVRPVSAPTCPENPCEEQSNG